LKKTKIKTVFCAAAFCLLLPLGAAMGQQATGRVFSLKDCINYAKENNSDIKTAKIDEEIAQKKVNETLGRGLPQLSIAGNLVDNLELPTQLIPGEFAGGVPGTYLPLKFGTKYNLSLTGQFSQLLFDGSFFIGVQAANESRNYYNQATENTRQAAFYNIAASFYQTLITERKIDLLMYNDSSLKKTLSESELLYNNGKLKEIELDKIRVNYNNLQYSIRNAKEGLKQAYNALKYSIGMPVSEKLALSRSASVFDSAKAQNDRIVPEEAAIENYDERADYRLLKTSFRLLELDKKNQISKYFPVLSAYGSYTYQAQSKEFDMFTKNADWFKSYSIGVKVDIPLFTGGQTYARIQQADLKLAQMEEELKNAESGIELQVSNAIISYQNAWNNVENESRNVKLAQKVYNVSQVEYKEGKSTAANLVDAEMKFREAQTNYINSLLSVYIARLDIEKAKGTLAKYLYDE